MKLIYLILSMSFLSSCIINSRTAIVSDYHPSISHSSYDTYQSVSNPSLSPGMNEAVVKGINAQLKAIGLEQGSQNPSILVYYQVYDQPFRLLSFDQPPLSNRMSVRASQKTSSSAWISRKQKIRGQTLLVTIFDTRGNQEVWRGCLSRTKLSSRYDYQATAQTILSDFTITEHRAQEASIAALED